MRNLTRIAFIVLGSIAFMYFTELGDFNPFSFGFYWSIFTAIIITLSIDRLVPSILKFNAKKMEKQIILNYKQNEKLLFESGSNHFKGVEGIGGKLFLTDKRLVFKSHKLNFQNHEEEFDPSQIENIENSNGKKFNFEYQGKLEKFIVDSPKEWIKQLESFKSP